MSKEYDDSYRELVFDIGNRKACLNVETLKNGNISVGLSISLLKPNEKILSDSLDLNLYSLDNLQYELRKKIIEKGVLMETRTSNLGQAFQGYEFIGMPKTEPQLLKIRFGDSRVEMNILDERYWPKSNIGSERRLQ